MDNNPPFNHVFSILLRTSLEIKQISTCRAKRIFVIPIKDLQPLLEWALCAA